MNAPLDLVTIGRRHRTSRSVALIALDWTRPHDPRVPLGHASIEANLRAHAIPTTPLVYSASALATPTVLAERIVADVLRADTDIVGIGAYVWNVSVVRDVINGLRARGSRASVVIGGPEVTYAPVDELVDRFVGADFFVRGAGEEALVALARGADDADGIIAVRGTRRSGFATIQLEKLPSPFLAGVLLIEPRQAMVRWETARGCSYACSFCAHPGEPEQRRIRRRNRDDLRAEIKLFVDGGVQRVNVLDPLFNASADHAIWILDELIAAGFAGELTLQCRFLAMRARTAELLDRFAALNVELEFGIQTTDEGVGDAVRRHSELPIAEETIGELHRRGIRFSVSLIYGLPHQTLESFRASLQWCVDRGVPEIRCYPLSLLVGTELWHQRRALGLVEGRDQSMPDVPIEVETPWMSSDDLAEARRISDLAARSKG